MRNGLAAAVLFACIGTAAGSETAPPPRSDWFLKVEGAAAGLGLFRGHNFPNGFPLPGGTLFKVTAHWRRLRFGVSIMEVWLDPGDGTLGPAPVPMALPVYVGYDIVDNRIRTWFFRSSVPNVYVEAGASYFPISALVLKGSLACDLDYYGVGMRLETGGYLLTDTGGTEKTLYAALLLRFPTLGNAP